MKKTKLKNKLMVMSLSMVIFVALISTVVVCMVINNQNRNASHELLKRSFNIIVDDIARVNKKLLADSQQMATINDMASKIKYIADYYRKVEEDIVGSTYKEVAQDIYNIGAMGNLWKVAFYDLAGDLIAFASMTDEGTLVGYAHRFPQLAFSVASLTPGEKLKSDAWEKADHPPDAIAPTFESDIPEHETVAFEEVDTFLSLVSSVPIMGQVYSEETEQLETRQIAFVTATRKLDRTFISRISRLTGMNINIFTSNGLSTGDIDSYRSLQMDAVEGVHKNWNLARQEIALNDIAVNGDPYYQGALPFYGRSGYVGAIAALYSKDVARANTWQMIKLLSLVSLACVFMIVPITFIFANLLTKPINRIIKALNTGAGQVTSASEQVSSSSQSLAAGASQQASSLEETSSSLEEMASMTKQNADSAAQADSLMKDANQVVDRANQSMGDLTNSMKEISTASEETSKIIKTIDEIAFQTNLLALNAAVEAARAGEAGSGFAVVADEVRNLAMRAADAAKNTSDLIEGTVKKVKDGANTVKTTNDAFSEVSTSASKVGELVGEIAAASNEQASGIEQVNRAVAEMDKVTQKTAAHAEESSSASEQMNAQAEQMKDVVDELVAIVGTDGHEKTRRKDKADTHHSGSAKDLAGRENFGSARVTKSGQKAESTQLKKKAKPSEIIPMEKEFKDF